MFLDYLGGFLKRERQEIGLSVEDLTTDLDTASLCFPGAWYLVKSANVIDVLTEAVQKILF